MLFSEGLGRLISSGELNPYRLATFPIAVTQRSFLWTWYQSQNYFEMGSILPLGPDTVTAVAAIYVSNRHELLFLMVKINRCWIRKSKPGMLFKFKCVELNNFMKTIHFVLHGLMINNFWINLSTYFEVWFFLNPKYWFLKWGWIFLKSVWRYSEEFRYSEYCLNLFRRIQTFWNLTESIWRIQTSFR